MFNVVTTTEPICTFKKCVKQFIFSFKQYIRTIKSSDAIGRTQYLGNGNGPLLPIEL